MLWSQPICDSSLDESVWSLIMYQSVSNFSHEDIMLIRVQISWKCGVNSMIFQQAQFLQCVFFDAMPLWGFTAKAIRLCSSVLQLLMRTFSPCQAVEPWLYWETPSNYWDLFSLFSACQRELVSCPCSSSGSASALSLNYLTNNVSHRDGPHVNTHVNQGAMVGQHDGALCLLTAV